MWHCKWSAARLKPSLRDGSDAVSILRLRPKTVHALAFSVLITGSVALSLPAAWGQSIPVEISASPILLVEPAVATPFPIELSATSSLPKQAFVRIRGLPSAAVLSEGHAIKAGNWAVPLAGLSNLKVTVAAGAEGRFQVLLALVLVDGAVVRETEITLAVISAPNTGTLPPQRQVNSASLGATPAMPSNPPASILSTPPSRPAPEREAPAAVPPNSTSNPQLKTEDRERALKFMQRGDYSLRAGNVTMARLFYQRAAEAGWAAGAFALAGTYDPAELARLRVMGGVDPDRAVAQKWYEKARELGSTQAAERLLKLGGR